MKKWLMATAVVGFTMGCVTAHKAATEYEPPPLTCEAWVASMISECTLIGMVELGEPSSLFIQTICPNNVGRIVALINKQDTLNLVEAKNVGAIEGPECLYEGVTYRTFSKEEAL